MRRNDRFFWILTGAFFLVFTVALTFAPRVIADTAKNDTQEYLRMLDYLFMLVKNNYVEDIPAEKLYEGAVKGLFESLGDPHSVYLSPEDMKDFTDTTVGEYGGIGLYISKPNQKEDTEPVTPPFVEVMAPIMDGTPAYRAGIHVGDLIVKIGGVSTADLTMDEVLDRLRGEPGSAVTITMKRGGTIEFDVKLVREVIQVPTTRKGMIPGGIGYLKIFQWTPYTEENVRDAITSFRAEGYKGIIVDVRGNPGGLLQSVVDTCDLFLSEGIIVSTRSRIASENAVYRARPEVAVDRSIPLVVLIDEFSASASEIFAGAMKDSKRGVLLGEKTFGKGSVQQIRGFGKGGFKLTMSRYYTPSDVNIDKIGILPDKEIKEPEFTEAELASLKILLEKNRIVDFVNANPAQNEAKIEGFIRTLKAEKIELGDRVLKRLIANEYNRRMDFPPVFDTEYDEVLKEAVRMIQAGEARP
jgi:carboxyl-terminal processing protease